MKKFYVSLLLVLAISFQGMVSLAEVAEIDVAEVDVTSVDVTSEDVTVDGDDALGGSNPCNIMCISGTVPREITCMLTNGFFITAMCTNSMIPLAFGTYLNACDSMGADASMFCNGRCNECGFMAQQCMCMQSFFTEELELTPEEQPTSE